jgi:HJR/Mrr/RecB family endonuclease
MFVINSGIKMFWQRRQPDYESYGRYSQAEKTYQVQREAWLLTQESWWKRLDGTSFEIAFERLLKKRGYKVIHTGKSGDGGVDLRLRVDSKEIIVQCKAYGTPVGPAAVRDLYGTIMHEGASHAWLVSTNGFSKKAKDFARGKDIDLLTIREFLESTS